MSWQDFERVVGEYFRRRGFVVAESGGGGPDGGVDIALNRGSDRYLVQCKHWRALRVGVEPVRELYGVIHARRSAGGFVVTSGTFTDEAKRFADGREIGLIDGEALAGSIRQQASPTRVEPTLGSIGETANSPPACPICKAPMQLRKASRGANAGQAFWGCPRFPTCRGTRPARFAEKSAALIESFSVDWRIEELFAEFIEETLDAGPLRAYSPELYRQKCLAVFEHVHESYAGREAGSA